MLKLNNIRLIRFEPEYHTAKLYEWYYSGEYQEFFRAYPQCPGAAEMARASTGKTFMVIDDDNDSLLIGMVRFFQEDDVSRSFEVGVLIERGHEHKSSGTTALKILLNWKFNYCNFYKAKLKVLAKNHRVCDILNKFGAHREGGTDAVLKKDSFFNGKFHDVAAYAIFKTDFNQLYQKEARLEAPVLKDASNGLSIRQ